MNLLSLLNKAETLKFDYTKDQTFLYIEYIQDLCSALNHEEPSVRYFTLQCLSTCKEHFDRILLNAPLCMQLGDSLCQLFLFDDLMQVRHLALSLISEFIPCAFQLQCPLSYLKYLFSLAKKMVSDILSVQKFQALPSRLSELFDATFQQDSEHIGWCISAFKFLASFLGEIHLIDPDFEQPIYFLLSCLISDQFHEEIVIASMECVIQLNKKTNSSSSFIHTLLLPKIKHYYQTRIQSNLNPSKSEAQNLKLKSKNSLLELDEALDQEEKMPQEDTDEKVKGSKSNFNYTLNSNEKSMIKPKNEASSSLVSDELLETLSKFLSIWYTRPSDEWILNLPEVSFDNETSKGYLYKRRCWLKHSSIFSPSSSFTVPAIPLFTFPPIRKASSKSVFALSHVPNDFSFPQQAPLDPSLSLSFTEEFQSLKTISNHITLSMAEGLSLNFIYAPYERTIYLNNLSDNKEYQVQIQASPPYFSVTPVLLHLPPQSSFPLTVKFVPKFNSKLRAQEVTGTIRIRTRHGMPLTALHLKGTLPPFLRCPVRELDFGSTFYGDSKCLFFPLSNCIKCECNYQISLSDTMNFQLSSLQSVLQVGERKLIKVILQPKLKPNLNTSFHLDETLVIKAQDTEACKIKLKAHVLLPLNISSFNLDFGQIDLSLDTQYKPLTITNHFNESIQLYFFATTREITCPERLVLSPKEQRKIRIGFTPFYNGLRQETLYIHGFTGSPFEIEIHAFSGKPIFAPLWDQVFLPPSIKKSKYIIFPILNVSSSKQKIFIQTNGEVLFNLADPRSYNSEPVMIELTPYSEEEQGYFLTISNVGTAPLQITHEAQSIGSHVSEFSLYHCLPNKSKRILISKHQVFYINLSPSLLEIDDFVFKFRHFLQSEVCFSKDTDQNDTSNALSTLTLGPSCFEFEPSELTIFGTLKRKVFVCQGTISLLNNSNEIQNFHLFAPSWFDIQVAKDGSLPPLSSLEVPFSIKIPSQFYKSDGDKNIFIGFISVMDEKNPRGFSSCTMYAVFHYPASIEFRENVQHLDFVAPKLLSKASKKLSLRNCLPIPCNFACELLPIEAVSTTSANAMLPLTKLPFSLAYSKLQLKPFATTVLDLFFNSSIAGQYTCQLKYVFTPILKHFSDPPTFSGSLYISCRAGPLDLKLTMDFLSFPDTPLSSPSATSIVIDNPTYFQPKLFAHSNLSNLVFSLNELMVPPASKYSKHITYHAHRPGAQVGFFHLVGFLWAAFLPFLSVGGHLNLELVGSGSLFKKPVLNLGLLVQGKTKRKYFEIKNTGSLYVNIIELNLEAKEKGVHFVCKAVDEVKLIPKSVDKYFEPYAPELDWDALDQDGGNADELPVTVFNVDTDKKETSVSHPQSKLSEVQGTHFTTITTGASGPISFLLTLKPFQSFFLYISVVSFESRSFHGTFSLKFSTFNASPSEIRLPIRCKSLRSLTLSETQLDFGICDSLQKNVKTMKVTNVSESRLDWHIRLDQLVLTNIQTHEEQILQGNHNFPVLFHPNKGYLLPNASTAIEVRLYSNTSSTDILAHCQLVSPDFCSIPFTVHGVLAQSLLELSLNELDFGVLSVGSNSNHQLTISNVGGIPCHFSLKTGHPYFYCEPEQGVIDGFDSIQVDISFFPRTPGAFSAELTILYSSTKGYFYPSLSLSLKGSSGFSDFYVHTKELDFGTAIFGSDNVAQIQVENKGNAEALVSLTSYHPSIFLAEKHPAIPPNSVQNLKVIYKPQFLETLNTKLFINSLDSRSDVFLVKALGKVGISSLSVAPKELFDCFDFGPCLIRGTYSKFITLKNTGNIALNFSIQIQSADSEISPFYVDINKGHIRVNQELVIHVNFRPTTMKAFVASLDINYEHHSLSTTLKGLGGQLILLINPPSILEFGVCRLYKIARKEIVLENKGNYGMVYQAFIADDSDQFRIVNSDGFCKAKEKTYIYVEFFPTSQEKTEASVKIHCGEDSWEIRLSGAGEESKLVLKHFDDEFLSDGTLETPPVIELGIQPTGSLSQIPFKLTNGGPFGIDFFIEPFRTPEFQITPQRGFITPGVCEILLLSFAPHSECTYTGSLCIIWENDPIHIVIKASGGIGSLEVKYTSKADLDSGSLDFGMVPISTDLAKRFFLVNDGLVGVSFEAYVTSPDFLLAPVGRPRTLETSILAGMIMTPSTNSPEPFSTSFKAMLQPKTNMEVAAKFMSRSTKYSKGKIFIHSETNRKEIELSGKGGTLQLSHKGNLIFEDIAARYTSVRKIVIRNAGSISTLLHFGWSLIRGGPTKSAFLELSEVYGPYHPKNGWVRNQLYLAKGIAKDTPLKAQDFWWMIRRIILPTKQDFDETSKVDTQSLENSNSDTHTSFALDDVLEFANASFNASNDKNYSDKQLLRNKKTFYDKSDSSDADSYAKKNNTQSSASVAKMKERRKKMLFHFYQRKQFFYSQIKATPMSSQLRNTITPFIRVEPSTCLITGSGEVELKIELNLPTEETFLATLVCTPQLPNTQKYEISLSATPKFVSAVIDDHRPVDFGCQLIGHREVIRRIIKNVGNRDFNFVVEQENRYIAVIPIRGHLAAGQSVMIEFAYEPVNDTPQTGSAHFIPDCSQPIRIPISGSGGHAKLSLPKNKKFDFGQCMLGKDTLVQVPLKAEGNATLHLTVFELAPGDSFFKGSGWPTSRISIHPNQVYNLPVIFNPRVENPNPGRLLIGNSTESYEVLLTGYGREAVLIVTKLTLEFHDCLIGNSYTQQLKLKNVGDVNYPITFELNPVEKALELSPNEMTIVPFSESYVDVTFKPTKEVKYQVSLSIISPYSTNTIPLSLHSGFGRLSLSSETIDFGLFELLSRPRKTFSIENTGTVSISYSIRQTSKPNLFHVTNSKGLLACGKTVPIVISYIQPLLGVFSETLLIKTEAQSAQYTIQVIGQCEKAVLKHEEFKSINLGICPALTTTTKALDLVNYGKFPLTYAVKNAYPLKFSSVKGKVEGGSKEHIEVSWHPSGGYELRTLVELVTNIGTFDIAIRGKAAFPELVLKKFMIDFGVCALSYTYTETLELYNKGKVNLNWVIPNVRDAFSIDKHQGTLGPKQVQELLVSFKPTAAGRHMSSFIIESKGLNFKEISLSGIGGNMSLQLPTSLDVGTCPWNHSIIKSFIVTNTGHVPIVANFDYPNLDSGEEPSIILTLPSPATISPDTSHQFFFHVKATHVGMIKSKLIMRTREKIYQIALRGTGVKIQLSESANILLNSSSSYPVKDPLMHLYKNDILDFWVDRVQRDIPSCLTNFLDSSVGTRNEALQDKLNQQALPISIFAVDDLESFTMDSILSYPIPKPKHCDISNVLNFLEPQLELNFSELLSRPPPFPEVKPNESKPQPAFKVNRNKPPLLSLNKSERRAKTIETFKRSPFKLND